MLCTCQYKETRGCEKNNFGHNEHDETMPNQNDEDSKGELPENFDYNSITNFFVGRINKIIISDMDDNIDQREMNTS